MQHVGVRPLGAMRDQSLLRICIPATVGTPLQAPPKRLLSLVYLFKGCDFGALVLAIAVFVATQCQATASGRDAYDVANSWFNAKAEMQTDRSRQSRRRF
jgi:hypothetical protein